MEPSEDKELNIKIVYKLDEYRRNVPEDHDFSRFLFTLLNKENDELAVYFIKTHNIKYLYNTLLNRPTYTPLMLAVENELPDIVEEIIIKIKMEVCNYCVEQIKNIKNTILSNAFTGLNINANSKDRCMGSLCTSFSEINIENNTPVRQIEYYQNIILKLEAGGEWPSFDFLNDIQNKIGYFKALEISKLKNSVDNTITDYTDIFQNYDNQEILKLLSTCPSGKCWFENKKMIKGISRKNPFSSRKNIPLENKDENVRLTLLRNKNKRQKSISEKRLSRTSIKEDKEDIETDDEDIDLGNGRTRRKKSRMKRKSAKRKSAKRKRSKSKRKRSKRRKSNRVLPKLKKGSLKKYGYSTAASDKKRHSALKKSLKAYGYSTLIKKLNAVKVLTKNTSPKNSKVYAKDIKWVRKINKSK